VCGGALPIVLVLVLILVLLVSDNPPRSAIISHIKLRRRWMILSICPPGTCNKLQLFAGSCGNLQDSFSATNYTSAFIRYCAYPVPPFSRSAQP
jgi:hypothetical protein